MIGQTISHYKILEKLGEGGMGVVYKAEDTKLKRTVALKFLSPELTRDPGAKERFIHEAQTASALQHTNICTIHDIDETADGRLFIVMDCYDGESLREKVARGPLNLEETVEIAVQVGSSLSKAHEKGIVHRDIKPANIFIATDGTVKILDFGLAKLVGGLRKSGRPEVTQMNYVSRVRIPTLMLNGRYDMTFPYETTVKPMFDLLGTPKEDKQLKLYDTDHFIPRNEFTREALSWLDHYLGPVR